MIKFSRITKGEFDVTFKKQINVSHQKKLAI